MQDMTTSELQGRYEARYEATKATNRQLMDNLEAVREELEAAKAHNRDLTSKLNAETRRVKELESDLAEAQGNYKVVSEQLDAQLSDCIRIKNQRDTWKKTAKWLCRQMKGGGNG